MTPTPTMWMRAALAAATALAAAARAQEPRPAHATAPGQDRPGPLVAKFFPEPPVPPELVQTPRQPSFAGKAYVRGPDGRWVPRVIPTPRRGDEGGGQDAPGPD